MFIVESGIELGHHATTCMSIILYSMDQRQLCIDAMEMFICVPGFYFLYWAGVVDAILLCAIDGFSSFTTPAYFHSHIAVYSTLKKRGWGNNRWRPQSVDVNIFLAKGWKSNLLLKLPPKRTNKLQSTFCVKYFNKALLKIPT